MLSDEGAHHVNCEITNLGPATVTIVQASLHDWGGNERVSYSACGATVLPGRTCGWGTTLPHPSGFGHGTRCHVEVAGNDDHIRTVMQTRNMDQTIRLVTEGSADPTDAGASSLKTGMFFDIGADRFDCEISNLGDQPVSIVEAGLRDYGGNERVSFGSCGPTVAPGGTCYWGTLLPHPSGFGYGTRCVLTLGGDITEVRTQAQTRNGDGSIRQTLAGRPRWAPAGSSALASGMVADVGANHVVCDLSNVGDQVITILAKSLLDSGGNERISASSCGATLDPGDTCSWGTGLPHPAGFGTGTRCAVSLAGAVDDVRAVMSTRNADESVRTLTEARPAWKAPGTTTLASPMLFDEGAPSAACTLSNVGSETLGIVGWSLRDYGGNDNTTASNCTATLAPGASCSWEISLPHPGGAGYGTRCQVDLIGSVDDARAVMVTRNGDASVRNLVVATPTPPIFVDGFETGDVSVWSATLP